jgi:8-oxo-dGTP pyrophosphatase MutT (NUDIX family)
MTQGVDYPGITIVYFCHDGNGNFIMAKRSKQSRDEHGKWDIGAGGLDFGYTVEDTLRKEIREEYCTDVVSYSFLGYRDVHRVHEGKPTHWVTLDFNVLIDPSKVSNGEPHKFEEVKMFTFETMPQPIHSQLPKFLRLYQSKLQS